MESIRRLILKYQDVLFPVFDVLLNGFNFFMHIYISWFISMNDYSIFNAALSFLAILFVFSISIQIFTTKEIGKSGENDAKANHLFTIVSLIVLMISVSLLLSSAYIMAFMRCDWVTVVILVLIFDVNLFLSFYRGVMQSRQHFFELNKSFYIEVVIKLILIVTLLPVVQGTIVPLICILIGMIFSLIHAYRLVTKEIHVKFQINKKVKALFKKLSYVITSNFFLYYLTSISLLVANYYIGEKAGIYAVSLKFSQLILAVGMSIMTVIVSYASELVINKHAFNKYIDKWLVRYFLGGIVIITGYQLIVRHFIGLLFGDGYLAASEIMVFQGLGYVMLTISYFLISVMIIMNIKIQTYILGLISIILTSVLFINHSSIKSIIRVEVISYGVLLGILMIIFLGMRAKKYD